MVLWYDHYRCTANKNVLDLFDLFRKSFHKTILVFLLLFGISSFYRNIIIHSLPLKVTSIKYKFTNIILQLCTVHIYNRNYKEYKSVTLISQKKIFNLMQETIHLQVDLNITSMKSSLHFLKKWRVLSDILQVFHSSN